MSDWKINDNSLEDIESCFEVVQENRGFKSPRVLFIGSRGEVEALSAALHNVAAVVGVTTVEAVRAFNQAVNTGEGGIHALTYYSPVERRFAIWPDDDIISPMWEFIKIDLRKQSMQNRYVTNVNRNRTTRYCTKMMSSRSGYRGIKALKRVNRR